MAKPPDFGLYDALGGATGCLKLATAFYARVARDPTLRPFFPGKTMKCAIEAFSAFLVQFLGGPSEDSQRRWWVSLRESHLRYRIGQKESAAWLQNMNAALDEIALEESSRAALRNFFDHSSAYLVNADSHPPRQEQENAHGAPLHSEIQTRWDAQRELDDAVAAVRDGDVQRAIMLAERYKSRRHLEPNRSPVAGLLMVMMASSQDAALRFVHDSIAAERELIKLRYGGRTLLHEASALGNLPLVKLLLQIGADAGSHDEGATPPCTGWPMAVRTLAARALFRSW